MVIESVLTYITELLHFYPKQDFVRFLGCFLESRITMIKLAKVLNTIHHVITTSLRGRCDALLKYNKSSAPPLMRLKFYEDSPIYPTRRPTTDLRRMMCNIVLDKQTDK